VGRAKNPIEKAMSYTVLARRYRPETFDDVVGQDAVAKTLKNAIAIDRVAHAYLFTGTRGVGKTTMARILAKSLNCLKYDSPTTTPCCECESCLGISDGSDIDVLEIDGASNTGVEHIRELRQNAIYRPARSRFKIYIIDEVHMLSTSAFNALLKTLEEPPDHVKFIFATTESSKILPTILSRCQRFDFRNIQPGDIAGYLQKILAEEGIEADGHVVKQVARLANGSMRDSLSLLDQLLSMAEGKLTQEVINDLLGTPRSELLLALGDFIAAGDAAGALNQLDMIFNDGLAAEQFIETLQQHFRDLLMLRNCGNETELVDIINPDIRQQFIEQSRRFDDTFLVYGITVTEELRRALRSSNSGRAMLEAAMVRLCCREQFADSRVLLEEIKRLGAGTSGSLPPSSPPPRPLAAAGANSRATAANYAKPAALAPTRSTAATAFAAGGLTEKTSDSASAAASMFDAQTSSQTAVNNGAAAPSIHLGHGIPEELTLGYLQMNWPKLLGEIGQQGGRFLQVTLSSSHPAAWENNVLVLGYAPTASNMKMMAQRSSSIKEAEAALTGLLGRTVKLQLQMEEAQEGNPKIPEQQSDGAKLNQKEINAAMSDPVVQDVQKILGGKIKRIEKKRGSH